MTLTFISGMFQGDFKVDKTYIIKEVLKILTENTEIKCDLKTIQYVSSIRRMKKINILYTFEEAGLFNGDILIIGDLRWKQ